MAASRFFSIFGLILFFNGVTLVRSSKSRPSLNVRGEELVTAELGHNVTLPCRFNMDHVIEFSMLVVHWSKDGVTKYFSNKTCCNFPGYDISEENLQRGAAPLQLLNANEDDAGVYTCSIKYETMEGSWNTTFHIQGKFTTEDRPSGDKTTKTPENSKTKYPFVPESTPQYRTLKYGLVSGVVAATGLIAVFVYFCFPG